MSTEDEMQQDRWIDVYSVAAGRNDVHMNEKTGEFRHRKWGHRPDGTEHDWLRGKPALLMSTEDRCSELFDACKQIISALDTNDEEELRNGYASARLAVERAMGNS